MIKRAYKVICLAWGCMVLLLASSCSSMSALRVGASGAGVDCFALKQKGPSLCSVTCLSSVCRYWGVEKDPHDIQKSLGKMPEGGYTLRQLRDWAREQGLQAFVVKGSMAKLKSHTDKGRPIIVTYKTGKHSNHSIVARSVAGDAYIYAMDPKSGKMVKLAGDKFLPKWTALENPMLVIARSSEPAEH